METYREPARDLEICADVDVLVAGGGPAGVAAALTAARRGASTLLVEQLGDLGGISTSGLMSHWTGGVTSALYEEVLRRSAGRNEGAWKDVITPTIDPEHLKTLYLDLMEEAGVRVRLYTFVSGVVRQGADITGLIVESKSGRQVIRARVVVDATGDGDVAARAGVPFTLGREGDGKMQPATIMFKVGGVDESRAVFPGSFETTVDTPRGELQALARAHLPFPAGHVLLYRTTHPGVVTCNMTNCIDVDGTRAEDLTQATVLCRRQMEHIVAFLREYAPGYEQCFALSSAALVGIRETRHFQGLYTLNEQDILDARRFDDWVVRDARFNFDVHNLTGAGLDETGAQKHFPQSKGYTIPYRCLVPVGVGGLLLAGRNISGTHLAHSNYRVMPICLALGEAAGIAAALAVAEGVPVDKVDATRIQQELLRS